MDSFTDDGIPIYGPTTLFPEINRSGFGQLYYGWSLLVRQLVLFTWYSVGPGNITPTGQSVGLGDPTLSVRADLQMCIVDHSVPRVPGGRQVVRHTDVQDRGTYGGYRHGPRHIHQYPYIRHWSTDGQIPRMARTYEDYLRFTPGGSKLA